MWLAPIPWAGRVWARQIVLQLRRWLPNRPLVLVADSSYAVLDLLHFCQSMVSPVTFITRLRLDAGLYQPAPPRRPGQNGRPPVKGKRLPTLKQLLEQPQTVWSKVTVGWCDGSQRTLEIASHTAVWYHSGKPPAPIRWVLIRDPLGEIQPQALLCTQLTIQPSQIIEWFALRWQPRCRIGEVRAHLGVETQRQWSDLAIARTTPALFGLFSPMPHRGHILRGDQQFPVRSAAWYAKSLPTFSDAIALVRQRLWLPSGTFCTSPPQTDTLKVPASLFNRLVESLSYAA